MTTLSAREERKKAIVDLLNKYSHVPDSLGQYTFNGTDIPQLGYWLRLFFTEKELFDLVLKHPAVHYILQRTPEIDELEHCIDLTLRIDAGNA